MVDSSDKRDFRRMMLDCRVEFRIAGKSQKHEGNLINLSATGLRLSTNVLLQEGDVLEVHVKPEKEITPPLDAIVEIVRVDTDAASGRTELGCKINQIIS